jgi:hypothetical protein
MGNNCPLHSAHPFGAKLKDTILISDKNGSLTPSPLCQQPRAQTYRRNSFFQSNSCLTPFVEARCAFVKLQLQQYLVPVATAGAVLPKQTIRTLYQNTCVNHVTAVSLTGFLAGAGRSI